MRSFGPRGAGRSTALAAVAVVLGCSGGGETGADADFTVAFDPPLLDAFVTVGIAAQIPLRATLSPRPATVVVPTATSTQADFEPAPTTYSASWWSP